MDRLVTLRSALQLRRSDYSYTVAELNQFLNDAYSDIWRRKKWSLGRRTHTFWTSVPVTTVPGAGNLSATFTQGRRTASLAADPAIPTLWGKTILVDSRPYRIQNISSDGRVWALDQPYAGTTGAQDVRVLNDEWALPRDAEDVVSVALVQGSSRRWEIKGKSPEVLEQRSYDAEGLPREFATIRKEAVPAPKTAPPVAVDTAAGTGPGTGTYLTWISFVDKQSGAESALSPSRSNPITNGNLWNVTLTATEGRQDFLLRLYRSADAGSDPFLVSETAGITGTVALDATDQYLGEPAPMGPSTQFLRLWPVPNSIEQIQVLYHAGWQRLSADEDRVVWGPQFAGVVLDGAEARMLEAADEQGRANQARARFEGGIQSMRKKDRANTAETIPMARRAQRTRARVTGTVESWNTS